MISDTNKKIKIIFSGGGTLGPVMPLVAVFQELKKRQPNWDFLWVGSKGGPEEEVAAKNNIAFAALVPAKLRRYWSWRNFIDIFKFLFAFFQSLFLIKKYQPDILISAGGFVSVPLHLAAAFLGKKTIIHQQDVVVGLANRIMTIFASYISVSLLKQTEEFDRRKTIYLGNPIREGLVHGNKEEAIKNFLLEPELPTILVLGGGTGAMSLNKIVAEIASEIVGEAQIIHMTGRGKEIVIPKMQGVSQDIFLKERYHPVQFLEEKNLADVLAVADIVICRAGFSTLSEMAVLGKPMIIAPIPQSHQVANAVYFSERSGAKIYYSDKEPVSILVDEIKELLNDSRGRIFMGRDLQKIMPPTAREKTAELIEELAKKI